MVVKKNGKKLSAANSGAGNGNGAAMGAPADESNLLSGTLEDYFNTQNAYQNGNLKGMNKEMTKHLLTGSGADNAMMVEKCDAIAAADSTEVEEEIERLDDKPVGEEATTRADNIIQQQSKADESGADSDADSVYEDDYESDNVSMDKSVAGLTLEDYLHVKSDDNAGTHPPTNSLGVHAEAKVVPQPLVQSKPVKKDKEPTAAAKKISPSPAIVTGMSLDHYLGASSSAMVDDDDEAAEPKGAHARAKKGKSKAKQSEGSAASSRRASLPTQDEVASHSQKRGRSKPKPPKPMQQSHSQAHQPSHHHHHSHHGHGSSGSSSVAKAILMGDSAQHLAAMPSAVSSGQKESKKSHSPSPLPKLLGSSSSSHSLTSHDHDAAADEKLPRLQHAGSGTSSNTSNSSNGSK